MTIDKTRFDIRPVPAEMACGECGDMGFPEWVTVTSGFAGRLVGLMGFHLCDKCEHSNVHLAASTRKDEDKLRDLAADFQSTWREKFAEMERAN